MVALPDGEAPPLQPQLFEPAEAIFGARPDQGRSTTEHAISVRYRVLEVAMTAVERGRCSLLEAERLALAQLGHHYRDASPQTKKKVTREVTRFFRYAQGWGLEWLDELDRTLVDDFVWSASMRRGRASEIKSTTAANRQSFLRTAFRLLADLGLDTPDLLGPPIPRDTPDGSRPLTPGELDVVRAVATGVFAITREPLLIAFSEAGATPAEIAEITVGDLDLSNGVVHLAGRVPRTNPLTAWGLEATRRWLCGTTHTGMRLCVGDGLDEVRATQSVTVGLSRIIRDAGLGSASGVTARSIRLGRARQILDEAGIEAAARFLGSASLDATAAALRHHWVAS